MKISLFGHFGTLNTGNESTLLAALSRLRSIYPDCDFCCICTNPESIAAEYGIEAVPISSRLRRIWDGRIRLDKRVGQASLGVIEELREYIRAFRTLAGTDMLIVPGTGLLTNAHGLSAWGPYNLFKWTLMARLRGSRVLLVSVGAGPIYGLMAQVLVKTALSLASYRSYRDDSSADYLESIGFRAARDPVYPDLVFSLPERFLPLATGDGVEHSRRVVGLGLMLYDGKLSAANPVPQTYPAYLDSLVAFVDWLLTHDYDVRLLLGDGDTVAIHDFKSSLRARLGAYDEKRVTDRPITSVQEILSQLAATDVVVATRFHNVLLALLLERPVIAISFHHKCASLMTDMGLSQYCLDIHQINAEGLIAQFQELERHREEVTRMITRRVEDSRRALDEQYNLLTSLSSDPLGS